MQNKTKNIFFKIISGLVLIQGVLQLLNLLGLVGYGRTTTSAITIATIILNVVFKAYSVTQFEALIIPVLFMLFTILNGRKNL